MNEQTSPYEDLPEQIRVRREKLDRLRAAGVDPYPAGIARTVTSADIRARFPELPADAATGEQVAVVGRIMLSRVGGKLCFATLQDGFGRIQVMVSLAEVGEESLASWKTDVDLGDHVRVEGEVITSKRGELSVLASSWQLAGKALRPWPEKWHGLADPEARVRQRYVDLTVNPDSRRMLQQRSDVVRAVRESMHTRGYIEVETPMLQVIPGGGTARPFVTHINAYDLPLYLRVAPELYLKRLLVGGVEKVFEINRNFRNEGVDRTHNPEFTMLEAYEAYGDYDTVADLTRGFVQEAAVATFGSTVVRHFDGTEYDLGGGWRQVTMYGVLSEALGEEVSPADELSRLTVLAEKHGIDVHPSWGPGRLAEELFDELVASTLVEPTFVRDYPQETSPLVRSHRQTAGLVEKWDLYIQGVEAGTGYTELNDPLEQRERFVAQAALREAGDDEAMWWDEDFLRALEHGMPPAGGMGLGIDRLLLFFTGLPLRESITFPLVKPGS
ncbi:MAG: lysine--tRNA ligase [Streptosporangiales bacterium]|nr:lysine--tRNA ligase [Streptosporangiales bacterium]